MSFALFKLTGLRFRIDQYVLQTLKTFENGNARQLHRCNCMFNCWAFPIDKNITKVIFFYAAQLSSEDISSTDWWNQVRNKKSPLFPVNNGSIGLILYKQIARSKLANRPNLDKVIFMNVLAVYIDPPPWHARWTEFSCFVPSGTRIISLDSRSHRDWSTLLAVNFPFQCMKRKPG